AVLSVTPASRDVAATAGSTTFTVGNTGGGSLDYTSAVTVGGSWLSIASGGSGTCPPDQTLTLNYTANTGAARSETVRVTAAGVSGSPVDVTVNQAAPPAEPLALQTVVSRRTHGAAGTFNIQFYPNINAVESRRQGVRVAIATFNRNVFCAGGTCDETDIDYFVTNGGITVGTITTQGNVLTVNLSGMATPNQLFLGFSGIEDSEGQTVGDYGCIRFLSGDTDANGTVNSFDLIGVRSRLGQAVTSSNFRRDVDASGAINSFDLIEVRARLNQTIGPCQ
ncbi:MAG TPA: BACON domain-containing carbohydrate-binding protein, partial [Phycisphaerae bacterium]|nr:BACON domain-containing carbohydrate-binding protein [Phycisphaerae bacterium]